MAQHNERAILCGRTFFLTVTVYSFFRLFPSVIDNLRLRANLLHTLYVVGGVKNTIFMACYIIILFG